MTRRNLCLLACLALAAKAHGSNSTLSNLDMSPSIEYYGCFNETTEVAKSDGSRALEGGKNQVREGEMTVQTCLDFCTNHDEVFTYSGLEWGRECWCANTLSEMAEKLDDEECDLPCDGDEETACGGNLKLSVYMRSGAQTLGLQLGAVALSGLAMLSNL